MGRRTPRPLAHRSARLLPRSRACRSPPSAWASRRRRAGSEPRRRRARRVLHDAGTARRPIRAAPSWPLQTRGPVPPWHTPSRAPSSTSAPPRRARETSPARGCRGNRRQPRCPLPSSRPAPPLGVLAAVDILHDEQSRVAEQAAGVAECDRGVAGSVERTDTLDCLGAKWTRSRATALSIFGRSLPVMR